MAVDVNAAFAECPVCYDDLCNDEQAVFVERRKRVCRHFFHLRCAEAVFLRAAAKTCPVCRVAFDNIMPVPDVKRNPAAWFDAVDLNGDGRLDKQEVLEVIKASVPVDIGVIEGRLEGMWSHWDLDGSGYIEKREVVDPARGLLAYVRTNLPRRIDKHSVPPLTTNYENCRLWFKYWDEDRSGTLELEEVLRATVKTFRISHNAAQLEMVRAVYEVLWPEFDPDGDGRITLAEFCRPGGLAETVIANLPLLSPHASPRRRRADGGARSQPQPQPSGKRLF